MVKKKWKEECCAILFFNCLFIPSIIFESILNLYKIYLILYFKEDFIFYQRINKTAKDKNTIKQKKNDVNAIKKWLW